MVQGGGMGGGSGGDSKAAHNIKQNFGDSSKLGGENIRLSSFSPSAAFD